MYNGVRWLYVDFKKQDKIKKSPQPLNLCKSVKSVGVILVPQISQIHTDLYLKNMGS